MVEIKGYTLIEVLICLAIFLIIINLVVNFSGELISSLEVTLNRLRLQREVNLAGEILLANLANATEISQTDNRLCFFDQAGEEKEIYLAEKGLYLNDENNLISQYISELDIDIDENLIHLKLTGELKGQELSIQTALKDKGVKDE